MKKLLFLLAAIFLLLTSCRPEKELEEQDKLADCTVFIYMVAENSLHPFVYDDINDILRATSKLKKGQRIVLYVDDRRLPKLYILDNNTNIRDLEPVFEFKNDFDSADPETLRRMINYMTILCPAREYGYVFWSHGSGWISQTTAEHAQTRSFGVDNQNNSGSNTGFHMNIPDMAAVLRDYGKARFIMFDACFMQSLEVAYELRDVTQYLIGSPAEIPGDGAPYDLQVPHFFAQPFSADSVVYDYWLRYKDDREYGIAISAIKSDELEQLARTTGQLIDIQTLATVNVNQYLNYFHFDEWSSSSAFPDAIDARSLMRRALSASDYETWYESFKRAVPYAYHTDRWYSDYSNYRHPIPDAEFGGASMYIPRNIYKTRRMAFYDQYYQSAWYNAIRK